MDLTNRLVAAIFLGRLDLVKSLVAQGADVNASDGKPLDMAVSCDRAEIAEYLLDQGADVGTQQLKTSVRTGNLSMVKLLVSRGGNADDAIVTAAADGNMNMLEYLLSQKISKERIDDAFLATISEGRLDTADYLRSMGADINAKDGIAVVSAARNNCFKSISYLYSLGIVVSNENLTRALLTTVWKSRCAMLKLLVALGANDAMKDKALATAVAEGRYAIVSCLLSLRTVPKESHLITATRREHHAITALLRDMIPLPSSGQEALVAANTPSSRLVARYL